MKRHNEWLDGRTDEWVDGQTDEWVGGLTDQSIIRWVGVGANGGVDRQMNWLVDVRSMKGWVDERIDRYMGGWMDSYNKASWWMER